MNDTDHKGVKSQKPVSYFFFYGIIPGFTITLFFLSTFVACVNHVARYPVLAIAHYSQVYFIEIILYTKPKLHTPNISDALYILLSLKIFISLNFCYTLTPFPYMCTI